MGWIHGVKKIGIKNVNMAGHIGGWDSGGASAMILHRFKGESA